MNDAGYIAAKPRTRFCVGLDLGQSQDYTALTIVKCVDGAPVLPLDLDR